MDEDIPAPPRLRSISPVFPVRSLPRALAHYASLGFGVQPYADGDGYGFADRDEVSLHLSLDTGHDDDSRHDHEHVGTAYLYVEDADALYDEWARPGVGGLARRVGDTPYKLREGSHVDPDGNDFPAERCATAAPVSILDGRPVLLTEWAEPVPREQRREAIRAAGGLGRLGELLGRPHTLPPGSGPVARPGGSWHHLADGHPSAEVAAASRMLAEAGYLFPEGERPAYEALCAEVAALDAAEGLPDALTHPDFVLANVVATPDGTILVDWAGAGRGPRVWSLAYLLYVEGAKDLRRVPVVLAGHRRHVTLSGEELDRLAAIARARPLIFAAWAVCTGRKTPSAALAEAADAATLTEAIAARARATHGS
jgi:hypothetical protein